MQRFRYSGYDASGARADGAIVAAGEAEARAELLQRGVMLLDLSADAGAPSLLKQFGAGRRVSLAEMELLSAELSLLLDGGVKIDRAVDLLRDAHPAGSRLERMLDDISGRLKRGAQFSECAAEHPDAFNAVYVSLLRAGEESGRLPAVLRSLSRDLAFRKDVMGQVAQAAVYPAVILLVSFLSVLFIFNSVVPRLATIFADAHDLPVYTRLLLGASGWFSRYQWPLLLLTAAAIGAGAAYWRSPVVAKWRGWALERVPVVRGLTEQIAKIRFCSSLSMMLESDLPIDRALNLALDTLGAARLRRQGALALEQVRRGAAPSGVLGLMGFFSATDLSLISVGEEGGRLARVFAEIAARGQDAFTRRVRQALNLLEPLLILGMGGLVGGIVVIMMLSITSVSNIGL